MSYQENPFSMLIQPLVLCDGSGSRVRSLSVQQYPKLLQQLAHSDPLFQVSLQQVRGLAELTPATLETIGGGSDPALPVIRPTMSWSTAPSPRRERLVSPSASSKSRNSNWHSATGKKAVTLGWVVCGCPAVRYGFSPYTRYDRVVMGARFQVQRVALSHGASLLLQMHHHRAEPWVVVHGNAKMATDENGIVCSEDIYDRVPA
jgi:mannose-6-phosphate isomerase-like protein (cupin superfamily)